MKTKEKLTITIRDTEIIGLLERFKELYNIKTCTGLVAHLLKIEKAKQDFGMVNINVK